MTFIVEALARRHDRSRFDCGSKPLDRYIRQQASQDVRRRVARVFVAIPERSVEVAGFYTLSAGSLERTALPPEEAGRLPRYPVPVALIGRLAVGRRWSGRGLGAALLAMCSVGWPAPARRLRSTRSPSMQRMREPRPFMSVSGSSASRTQQDGACSVRWLPPSGCSRTESHVDHRATPRGWRLSHGRVTSACHESGPPYATTGRVSRNCCEPTDRRDSRHAM